MMKLFVTTILVCVMGSAAKHSCTHSPLEPTTFDKLPEDIQGRLNKRLKTQFDSNTKIYKYRVHVTKSDGSGITFDPYMITPQTGKTIYLKVRGDEADENRFLTLNFKQEDFERFYSTCSASAA
ncbi:hypothetical protein GCK32_012440 [Trichostrongylus colubriformis]|uniref:Secreted protein n=1 Tax=Trichostrongylus colubriformis TaxID=6319 RepID=A0AAN8F3Z1_TRICO